ncbi:MAG: DUF58 domain-containing protein [Nitrospirae bacterium]|nr:DUF58 domain-containing protein [Nitrospirota bacterium]
MSALLGLMGVSGFFGKRNLSGVDVDLDFPGELFAASHLPVKITLVNKRRILPAFLIRVRIDNYEVLFPFVRARCSAAKYIEIYFPKRGSYRVEQSYISSVYPFNFFTRYRRIARPYGAVVFPQARRCELHSSLQSLTLHAGKDTSYKPGYDGEMISVRTYVSGDPSRYIHWKSSARTGELKTKEFSVESRRPVIIDFEKVDIPDREEKLSCLTYFIIKSFRDNIPVGLRMKERVYKPGLSKTHRISMLRELALYGEK